MLGLAGHAVSVPSRSPADGAESLFRAEVSLGHVLLVSGMQRAAWSVAQDGGDDEADDDDDDYGEARDELRSDIEPLRSGRDGPSRTESPRRAR